MTRRLAIAALLAGLALLAYAAWVDVPLGRQSFETWR